VEYKENDEVRLTCTVCAALAYVLINKVEEGWLMILENVPQNEKLTLFLDYYIQQLMENQNIPIEMWNINKHRHRTSNAVEGGNSKLNSTIGKQQTNVFLQLQKLKKQLVSCQLKSKEPVKPRSKTKKDVCKTRLKNEIIIEEWINKMIRKKCLKTSRYKNVNNYK
jgi:hypothetical protein